MCTPGYLPTHKVHFGRDGAPSLTSSADLSQMGSLRGEDPLTLLSSSIKDPGSPSGGNIYRVQKLLRTCLGLTVFSTVDERSMYAFRAYPFFEWPWSASHGLALVMREGQNKYALDGRWFMVGRMIDCHQKRSASFHLLHEVILPPSLRPSHWNLDL